MGRAHQAAAGALVCVCPLSLLLRVSHIREKFWRFSRLFEVLSTSGHSVWPYDPAPRIFSVTNWTPFRVEEGALPRSHEASKQRTCDKIFYSRYFLHAAQPPTTWFGRSIMAAMLLLKMETTAADNEGLRTQLEAASAGSAAANDATRSVRVSFLLFDWSSWAYLPVPASAVYSLSASRGHPHPPLQHTRTDRPTATYHMHTGRNAQCHILHRRAAPERLLHIHT